jgi:serine/threonine-protein kinase
VGTVLGGRFRLDARIASGGMSTVYRAFDTVLEREVAIKLMHRDIASDSHQLERFRREARAVARLNHPHIVTVIDAGEDDGMPYIVLEYVGGSTLKERIRQGPMDISEAVAYAIEVARALGAAHEQQIVHRDVKPQNVLIDSEGSAKITDFGIARSLTMEGLTADGRVLGTTDYVSPEQALGHRVTPQSDLYSLGIVLWEMLAGEVPFRAESQVAVAMRHVRDDLPDIQERRPEVSAALAAAIDHATAKDLARRCAGANQMAAELEEVLALETARHPEAGGPQATAVLRTLPESTRRRVPLRARVRGGALLALVLLACAGIGVGVYALVSHTHRGVPPPANVPAPRAAPVAVQLRQDAATAYNPFGDTPENPTSAALAIDGDTGTSWTTQQYYDLKLNKPGVGLYVDASPGVAATYMVISTPTPGFTAEVWAADTIKRLPAPNTMPLGQRGWSQIAEAATIRNDTRIALDGGGHRYRYYLLWITQLPPGQESAAVSELGLFR